MTSAAIDPRSVVRLTLSGDDLETIGFALVRAARYERERISLYRSAGRSDALQGARYRLLRIEALKDALDVAPISLDAESVQAGPSD